MILDKVGAFFVANLVVVASSGSGPVGPIKIYSVGECDPVINKIDFNVQINTESDDTISIKFKFTTTEDYGDDVDLTIVADKWENNEWQKDAYSTDTKFFPFFNQYLGKIWKNIREQISPKITENDFVPAGEYTLDFFQDTWKNVDLDQIMYGRFMITFTASKDDEEIVCAVTEVEAFEPETKF